MRSDELIRRPLVDLDGFDEVKALEVLRGLSLGESRDRVCARVGVSVETLLYWRKRDASFAENYDRALEYRRESALELSYQRDFCDVYAGREDADRAAGRQKLLDRYLKMSEGRGDSEVKVNIDLRGLGGSST